MQRVKVIIKGTVQGVGYRAWTVKIAIKNGLCGEVKNLPEGHVEVLMEGDQSAIQLMLNALHQGPPAAYVKEVVVEELPYAGTLADFIIRN